MMMFRSGISEYNKRSTTSSSHASSLQKLYMAEKKENSGTCTYYNTKLGVKNELDADDVLHI
jgi:hypothetical protein